MCTHLPQEQLVLNLELSVGPAGASNIDVAEADLRVSSLREKVNKKEEFHTACSELLSARCLPVESKTT